MTRNEACRILAKAFCESQLIIADLVPPCPCNGDPTRCHSLTLYMKEASKGIVALEKAGVCFDFTEAPTGANDIVDATVHNTEECESHQCP